MRRARGERGAVLVETAIVALFLVGLLLGITEYGFAWRQGTAVDKAVQSAGRAAGSGADGAFADYQALTTLKAGLASARNVSIEKVVIFRSTTADGSVPATCLTGSQLGVCNHYVAADLDRPPADFGCGSGDVDAAWCPSTSRNRQRNPNPDYVGVYVEARYTGLTGLIPGGIDIDRTAVYALEPCAFGLPGC